MSEERSSPRAKLSDDPFVSLTVSLYLFPPGSLRNRASLRAVSGCQPAVRSSVSVNIHSNPSGDVERNSFLLIWQGSELFSRFKTLGDVRRIRLQWSVGRKAR